MSCRPRSRLFSERLCGALLATMVWLSAAAAPSDQPDLAVVVHGAVPKDDISLADLKKMLLGDKRFWVPSKPVTILIQSPSWERDFIIGEIMEMSETQFRQYWISKVFRAEATAGPKVVLSNEMAVTLISKLPGAMALVRADQVPEDVKVLKVDGLLPGSDDYPL